MLLVPILGKLSRLTVIMGNLTDQNLIIDRVDISLYSGRLGVVIRYEFDRLGIALSGRGLALLN